MGKERRLVRNLGLAILSTFTHNKKHTTKTSEVATLTRNVSQAGQTNVDEEVTTASSLLKWKKRVGYRVE